MDFKGLYQILQQHRRLIFSHEDVRSFYPRENRLNLKRMLSRWTAKGWVYRLKRGLYELTFPQDFNIPDLYVANRLYDPSYISLETALSHYSIIPEVSQAVTSLSTKPTRSFKNKHGLFIYRTIPPACFCGYLVEQQGPYSVFLAEPEKALVDYIYFKTYRRRHYDFHEERFDQTAVRRLDRRKMNQYAGQYGIDLKEFYAHLRSAR